MHTFVKKLPNLLSLCRIPLSFLLLLTRPLGKPFFLLYLLCGATDLLDGFLARKLKATSVFGARLDSAADLIFAAVLLYLFFPLLTTLPALLIWTCAIALLRLCAALVAKKRFGRFAMLHTWGNKAAGFLLFFLPFALLLRINYYFCFLFAATTLSALEELFLQLRAPSLDLNRRSIFISK